MMASPVGKDPGPGAAASIVSEMYPHDLGARVGGAADPSLVGLLPKHGRPVPYPHPAPVELVP